LLYHSAYTNKALTGRTVTVNLMSHGDRVEVMEEVLRRGGQILEDDVEDDY
jgi:hypothetical protein